MFATMSGCPALDCGVDREDRRRFLERHAEGGQQDRTSCRIRRTVGRGAAFAGANPHRGYSGWSCHLGMLRAFPRSFRRHRGMNTRSQSHATTIGRQPPAAGPR